MVRMMPFLRSLTPPHVVQNRECADVVKEPVDGQIPPLGVLLGGSEGVVAQDEAVFLLEGKRRAAAERTYLDALVSRKEYVDEPETPADDAAVPEDLTQPVGPRIRGNVKILGAVL